VESKADYKTVTKWPPNVYFGDNTELYCSMLACY